MAFHEIAVPHKDILSKRFSSEVYAAKLWDVYNKRGSEEHKDSTTFFEKTYMTKTLRKAIMRRSALQNRYYRDGKLESGQAFKKQELHK